MKPPSTTAPVRARQNPNAAGSRPCWYAARAIGPSSANARADATTKAAPAAADLCMVMPPVTPLPAISEGQVHRGDTHDSGEPVLYGAAMISRCRSSSAGTSPRSTRPIPHSVQIPQARGPPGLAARAASISRT